MASRRSDFPELLAGVKGRIQAAQPRAVLAVNTELVPLYWDIGRFVHPMAFPAADANGQPPVAQIPWAHNALRSRPTSRIWGMASRKNAMEKPSATPRGCRARGARGRFAAARPNKAIVQESLARLPWYHHIALLQQCKPPDRHVAEGSARQSADRGRDRGAVGAEAGEAMRGECRCVVRKPRSTATVRRQQAEATNLDAAIATHLTEVWYGY
jgi:hypothetical protein